jgi:hypothetical protein
LPNFIIIGGQRCGTTTLYNYLARHPHIAPASGKELHFFDLSYERGQTWYQTHFPTKLYQQFRQIKGTRPLITGESSPYYLFHPHVPQRVAAMCPSAKLIVLLRNPVDRAYSHYYHEIRWGFEVASSFEEAINMETDRMDGELDKLLADENYYSFSHHHHTYLTRGIYIDQLQNWLNYFPREQIFILSSEQFYEQTPAMFRNIVQFLDLPAWKPAKYKNYNQANNPDIPPATRERLTEYFKPHNARLYEFLGERFEWE